LPGLAAADAVELVAVCDESPDLVHELSYQLHVKGYTDFREMFASEQLDLAVVCVPHHVGREVIEAAAEHGVHVLKEKPFAVSIDDARELATICDGAGIKLMVTLQRRFNPIYTSWRIRSALRSWWTPSTRCTSTTLPRDGEAALHRQAAGASSTWVTTWST
jgi:predicted dehydrogenase